MAKIRHIAYGAEDVDGMAQFFVGAVGMTMVHKPKDGAVDLSDDSINIAILSLAANRSRGAGLEYIGFSAADDQDQIRRVEAAGGVREPTRSRYETKFKGPEGIIVDVGSWPGSESVGNE